MELHCNIRLNELWSCVMNGSGGGAVWVSGTLDPVLRSVDLTCCLCVLLDHFNSIDHFNIARTWYSACAALSHNENNLYLVAV